MVERAAGPRVRRAHRVLGLVLTLPILLWAATGLLFHLKPGWGAAYGSLSLPLRPLSGSVAVPAGADWLETRRLRTELGDHLLVRTAAGWQHLDANTLSPFPEPDEAKQTALVESAIVGERERYGHVIGRDGGAFVTSTGAHIELDWTRLQLAQRGRDTERIDLLYRLHYLQWTGIPAIDRPFALLGLLGLMGLALLGLHLARR